MRQPEIEHYDIRIDLPGPGDGVEAVVHERDLEAGAVEVGAYHCGEGHLVLDHQGSQAGGGDRRARGGVGGALSGVGCHGPILATAATRWRCSSENLHRTRPRDTG
ncbi:hypothetical protein EBESD8_39890 [Rhodococcus aetherivorans]|nr:hypothetical protein EBESD8_39890 [Rhodococcus aetherivorans]